MPDRVEILELPGYAPDPALDAVAVRLFVPRYRHLDETQIELWNTLTEILTAARWQATGVTHRWHPAPPAMDVPRILAEARAVEAWRAQNCPEKTLKGITAIKGRIWALLGPAAERHNK